MTYEFVHVNILNNVNAYTLSREQLVEARFNLFKKIIIKVRDAPMYQATIFIG